ncbi:MAG: 3-hydroxyacyl-[acyl-carrier-protein] dehydratase FabZ [Candidatus Muproteobacteria bacterium RIFCSPHIGHO2_12_FULL_60_33]|uniref:3-hydroxyacyl-[acyl-carrier-protein] dehydratase FabZ n=1 Tax=Candidatus Muproteobacteria bacterium RIFCSPLOWO2_01_FULL_60_18 TaxID=1817768 RepID=A0A1F6U047_9PROT|nr:MAG: 3-hydroxyacyl-[acyl-carrier-protein] dehydratase FabZ [Candidatus Muproteobacteria bacterium RIFCSPLOWO2_01_FULL_60_18]OGI53223.1 MAG: 3-hydroxyacyl-[acyl-carrier-protein] dehydratase FabZ [Candidatus Muproteobacteria bacterium RIFCSPHIGHO2_01_60_12]OGI54167.1 MAG: 3-hydroxyacyl-[acyl-carrier-protein] dehydratase FabZ [Candidatus Muproteobacteria bacterium RIFCSPHIGHO2_12_FULL_60_33]OGI56343.1 MAG: 3-hydroxyacyl-[acyl-carrier-protein] dehydratase FabZ [Candidatus Muproteobacteria bacteri
MNSLDIHEVLKYLPHRYPFLLIDRVLDYTENGSLTAIKNVTMNEPFFQGHFPNRPVMPGVLMIEAMAQACAILSFKIMGSLPSKNSVYYFVGIDKARFKRPVEPGDQLVIQARLKRQMKGIWLFESSAHVGEELCCSADLMCTYKEA